MAIRLHWKNLAKRKRVFRTMQIPVGYLLNNTGAANLHSPSLTDSNSDRRRTARVRLAIKVLVEGKDAQGAAFCETTRTEVVTGNGGSVILPRDLVGGSVITLFTKHGQTYGRIVGKVGVLDGGYVYGVAFLDKESRTFWGVVFPDISEHEPPALALECQACSKQEHARLDVVEGMVYDANRLVGRWCERCQGTTLWQPSEIVDNPEFVAEKVALAHAISTLEPRPRILNERKHTRIPLRNAKACIARPGENDDVVEVRDLSRGGVRFSSYNHYSVGTWVRVAVPFTAGATNIFMEGRIVRTKPRPSMGLPGEYAIQFKRQ